MRRIVGPAGHVAIALVASLVILQLVPLRGAAATSLPPKPDRQESVDRQLLVGFAQDTSESARDAVVAKHGARTVRKLADINVRLIELPPGQTMATSRQALQAEKGVAYTEPNYVDHLARAPSDTYYGYLWGLHNTGQNIGQTGTPGADISAEQAWNITTGSQSIVVGVIDSGIDYTHPDLAANMWQAPAGWSLYGCGPGTYGYDSYYGTCDPYDVFGHGTHVAGTIGASGNNASGVAGVNWNVKLMSLAASDSSGSLTCYSEALAIDYGVQAKIQGVNLRVMNASWGGLSPCQTLQNEISYAGNNGILFVAAAGNGGSDGIGDNNDVTPTYPASYNLPNIISVAATDNRDNLTSFSNYGAASVHLGAPGLNILSTLPTYPVELNGYTSNDWYDFLSGTSMAAPHVAGAAALVLSAPGLGGLTVAQLKDRLLNCGDPDPALAGKTVTGKRLDVYRAITGCSAPTYTLTLTSTAGGTVGASPPGPTYPAGTPVTLTATAFSGYTFTGWTLDGAPAGNANPAVLTMDANHTVVANFAPVGGWSPWASQGGILTDSPAAAGLGSRVYVFAKGSDAALYVKSSDTAGNFTDWQDLGGILTAAPAAASFNGRLYAFAKGSDNALYVKSSADGMTWTDWSDQGGILLAPPAAASANGQLFVFAMGTDKALYAKSTADGVNWTDWQRLGGILTAAPAAAGFQGRIYAFAKGSDNALYVKSSPDGVTWTDWSDLAGTLVAAPAAAATGDGSTLYAVATTPGGVVYERHSTDGTNWTPWTSLGGQVVGPPAAASIQGGPLFVFARWVDNALWERHLSP